MPAKNETVSHNVAGKDFKILHLSDWHFDDEYQEGTEADCPGIICCRPPKSFIGNETIKRAAGKFGDYKCDTNRALSNAVMAKVNH